MEATRWRQHNEMETILVSAPLFLSKSHSKLSSPWKASSTVLFRLRPSPRSPDLCAKNEHRTVSCALSNSCTSPFRTMSRCCKFQGEEADQCARVGREEEGTSSNRPELGGVVLELQSAALSEDVLLLCDNAAVLCGIKKWVRQGGKATLATASDADILQEIVCLLTQRVRAGGKATFLIKVKSHRGEPINERANTLAEERREISDDNKWWDVRTDRMTFGVHKENTTVRSVWTNRVRNAFRKQAGWAELQEVRATAAKHWTERVWFWHNQCLMRSLKKEQRHQGGVSRMGRNGARNALRI